MSPQSQFKGMTYKTKRIVQMVVCQGPSGIIQFNPQRTGSLLSGRQAGPE